MTKKKSRVEYRNGSSNDFRAIPNPRYCNLSKEQAHSLARRESFGSKFEYCVVSGRGKRTIYVDGESREIR